MDRTQDSDRAYQNSAFIPGSDGMPGQWQARAAAFRADARAELDLPYGASERNRFDLFHPQGSPRGLLMFIHGGYWLAFGRETWSHLAAGSVARGWAVAMPSYMATASDAAIRSPSAFTCFFSSSRSSAARSRCAISSRSFSVRRFAASSSVSVRQP